MTTNTWADFCAFFPNATRPNSDLKERVWSVAELRAELARTAELIPKMVANGLHQGSRKRRVRMMLISQMIRRQT